MRKDDVIRWYGSAWRAAIALDINRQTFHKLPDPIPKSYACELEVITAGGLRVDWSWYPRKHPIPDKLPAARTQL